MAHVELEDLFRKYAQDGDVEALAEVFDRTAPGLTRLALRLIGDRDRAEDLVQETFLIAIEQPGAFDAKRKLTPWLVGILANCASSTRRRTKRKVEPGRLSSRQVVTPAEEAIAIENKVAIEAALQGLSTQQREVVEAKLHGQNLDELGASRNVLRVRLHRALLRMRASLPPGLATVFAVLFLHSTALAKTRAHVLHRANKRALQSGGGAIGALGVGSAVLTKNLLILGSLVVALYTGLALREALQPDGSVPEMAQGHAAESASPIALASTQDEDGPPSVRPASDRALVFDAEVTEETGEPKTSASISGVVLDRNGASVPNATVSLWHDSYKAFHGAAPDISTRTTSSGAFTLDGVRSNFVLSAKTKSQVCRQGLNGHKTTFDSLTNVVLIVEPALVLRGAVLAPDGTPVQGAEVTGTTSQRSSVEKDMTETQGVRKIGAGSWRTQSDQNGEFELVDVPSRRIRVTTTKRPYLVRTTSHLATDGLAKIVLDPGLSLRGIVYDSTGAPAAGARIRKKSHSSNLQTVEREAISDKNGRFLVLSIIEVDPMARAAYGTTNSIAIHLDGHAVQVVPDVAPGPDGGEFVRVDMVKEKTISGRIVDGAGTPLQSVKVKIEALLMDVHNRRLADSWGYDWTGLEVEIETDEDGRFHFEKLSDGPHKLHCKSADDEDLFRVVTVEAGAPEVEILLDSANLDRATLQGAVVDAFTGEPVTSFKVTPMISTSATGKSGRNRYFDSASGDFQIVAYPTDSIEMHFSAEGYAELVLPLKNYPLGETKLAIKLLPARSLSLSVFEGKSGRPARGRVSISNWDGAVRTIYTGGIGLEVISLDNGKLHLHDLPAERLLITIEAGRRKPHETWVDLTTPQKGELQIVLPDE